MELHCLRLGPGAVLCHAVATTLPASKLAHASAPPDNLPKGFVPDLRDDLTFPRSMECDYTKLSEVMTGPTHFRWAPFDAKLNAASRPMTAIPTTTSP